jgi:hypothetical protein
MLGKYKVNVEKKCAKMGISFQEFAAFCDVKKFGGINSLMSFYEISKDKDEDKMKKIFQILFDKILRRGYLKTVFEEGKMDRPLSYIEYKNKYLLNLQTNSH